ncbi:WxL domain-containing protein [uncultured Vagococcus sp.]|uniref:WxL domain-containing protein n=1 Tax=uncultured Vagococcus sp. TaxID=189676 RepID=UPI0028D2BA6A|nr:WxL domain-containing protein [uncultured Vagococcus sp.]
MKIQQVLTTVTIASLGLVLLAPNALAATGVVGGNLPSAGTVTVKEGEAGGGEDKKDPEDPDKEVETDPGEVTENPDTGSLIIQAVSNLRFGEIKTGVTAQTPFAKPTMIKPVDDSGVAGTAVERGNYIQWADIRGGETNFGYTLSAALTQQFVNDADAELTASTISFNNGMMNSSATYANWGNLDKTAFVLSEEGGSQNVVTADKDTKKGKGEYFVEFGQSAAWDTANHPGTGGQANTAANSVQLTVPKATASTMAVGDYEGIVTWTLAATL